MTENLKSSLLKSSEEGLEEAAVDNRERKEKTKLRELLGDEIVPDERGSSERPNKLSKHLTEEEVAACITALQAAARNAETMDPDFTQAEKTLRKLGHKFNRNQLSFMWKAWQRNPVIHEVLRSATALRLLEELPKIQEKYLDVVNVGLDVMTNELEKLRDKGNRDTRGDNLASVMTAISQAMDKMRDLAGIPKEATRHEVEVTHQGPPKVIKINEVNFDNSEIVDLEELKSTAAPNRDKELEVVEGQVVLTNEDFSARGNNENETTPDEQPRQQQ